MWSKRFNKVKGKINQNLKYSEHYKNRINKFNNISRD